MMMMIVLLLFLQKQSLAFAVYLFGIGTLHTGPGLKKKKKKKKKRLYVAPVWTTAHERSVRIVSVFLVARVVSTLLHTLQDQKMSLAKIEDLDCMKPCGANRRR
jgi:hypothetical protein